MSAAIQPAFGQTHESPPLDVTFSGPSECGARDRLLEFSRELLGSDADHAGVSVMAKVTAASERRYKLRLELRGAVTGDRTISGDNCEEALRAGAVVIALAVNPNALATQPTAERPVATEPDALPEVSLASPTPTPAPPDAKPPDAKPMSVVDPPDPLPALADDESSQTATNLDTLIFGVSGRAAFGLAPAARLGVKGVVGVVWRDVQVRVHGFFDPSTHHDDALAGAVRFTSLGGGADLCARVWSWSRLRVGLCGGWSLTEVNASAPNVDNPTAQDALVSAGSLNVGVGVSVARRVALVVEGGYSIPTSRPRFVVEAEGANSSPVFRVTPGPLAALGLEFGL